MCCCSRSLYISGKMAEFDATKPSKEFFLLSLTLEAKCVIGRCRSASWQSHYYPHTNMSQPIDIKSLSRSTKKYFIMGGNLPWLIRCWLLVSHTLSPPAFVIYCCVTDELKSSLLNVKSCHKHICQQIFRAVRCCYLHIYEWRKKV